MMENFGTEPKILCKPLRSSLFHSGSFRKSKRIVADKFFISALLKYKTEHCDTSSGNETSSEVFFGVSVRKKIVKHAVCRNRVRRLVRVAINDASKDECFRELFCHLHFIMVIWTAPLEKPSLLQLPEVKANLADTLHKLNEFYIYKQNAFRTQHRCQ